MAESGVEPGPTVGQRSHRGEVGAFRESGQRDRHVGQVGGVAGAHHVAGAEPYQLDRLSLTLPLPASAQEARRRWELQLGGGDDYELCFTAPPGAREAFRRLCAAAGMRAAPTVIISRGRSR